MDQSIGWRAPAPYLISAWVKPAFLAFVLSAWLAACAQPQTSMPSSRSAQAGLETVFRSDDADLIAEMIQQVMDMPGGSTTDIDTLVRAIRTTEAGRAAADHAVAVLTAALDAPETDAAENVVLGNMGGAVPGPRRGALLVALAPLAPQGRHRSLFLAEFRKELDQQSGSLFAASLSRRAVASAAFLYEQDRQNRAAFVADAEGNLRQTLLFVAVQRRLSLPANRLRPVVDELVGAFARDDGRNLMDTPLGYDKGVAAGLALRLLEVDGAPPAVPPTARAALARARAAVDLGEPERALPALREAASLPRDARSNVLWLDTAGSLFERDSDRQPEIAALAERLVPSGEAGPNLSALAALGSISHSGEAERILRTTSQDEDQTLPAGALQYLIRAGRATLAMAAYCDSPAARANSAADMSIPGWDELTRTMPAEDAASFAASIVGREPERARSACIVTLLYGQGNAGKTRARDSVLLALRARPDLVRVIGEINQTADPSSMSPAAIAACRRIDTALDRAQALRRIGEAELVGFSLVCAGRLMNEGYPGPYWGDRYGGLLRTAAAPQILALAAPNVIWQTSIAGAAPAWNPDQMLGLFVDGRLDRARADYAALISPLLTGPLDRDEADGMVVEMSGNGPHTGPARLLLAVGDDPGLVAWVLARRSDYRVAGRGALAGTFSTLRRAWHDAGQAERRLARAEASFELTTPAAVEARARQLRLTRRKIGEEAAFAVQQLCGRRTQSEPGRSVLPFGLRFGVGDVCIGDASGEARMLSRDLRGAGLTAAAAAIEYELRRESTGGIVQWALSVIAAHMLVWGLLLLLYPYSPTVQASVFWNPWVRKYAGLGYVQLLLLVVPPFTRRLLAPFRNGFTRDAQLDSFRPEIYFDDIRGLRHRPEGPEPGRLAALIPLVNGKIWLEALSGSGKSWFLRNLATRIRRPLIFLNATSCVGGVPGAIKARTHGWLAESDFLEQLIYTGRVVLIVDGLNEVAAAIRSDIVAYADRFPRGRILIATQAVQTTRPIGAQRVEVEPLSRAQIEGFLIGRAEEVLAPGEDRAAFAAAVASFLDSLERGTPKEQRELLNFVSNPMDLRLVAGLLAKGATPDLLNLQKQQIMLVEADYLVANASQFPIVEFAEALYRLRCDNKPLTLGADDWPAEREALRAQRLVLRIDAPSEGERWRFRHDKITDYFLYVAFQRDQRRLTEHLSDNRFIGVYVLVARDLPEAKAMGLLHEISWAGGESDDFTVCKAFQDALTQKIALLRAAKAPQRAGARGGKGSKRPKRAANRRNPAPPA